MANALPCVTTTACLAGLTLVNDENGALVAPEDICGLKQAMTDILSDNKKRAAMQAGAIKTIQNYTLENMAIRHIEIFKSLK